MTGELFFNGTDAATFGVMMGEGTFAALIAPAPAKEYITNETRLKSGKSYVQDSLRLNERTIALQLYIRASNRADLYGKMQSLVSHILEKKKIDITTKYQQGVTYRTMYKSFAQLTEFNGRAAKFVLNVVETDPTNRS